MTDVRAVAYEALLAAEDGRSITLTKDVLDKYSYLDRQSRSFLKILIEGVTERRITLDYVIDCYSKISTSKMKKQIRVLLRMGTYQLLYMDGVAQFAAVNETVRLTRKTGLSALSGFVNGVLRSIARHKDDIKWPSADTDLTEYMSVKYSCPKWIVDKLIREQGRENAQTLLGSSVSVRNVTARVNLSQTTVEQALSECSGRASDVCKEVIILDDFDTVPDIPAFANGSICIMDTASALVGLLSGIRQDDTVIDLCAAPGGKSMHAADICTKGRVLSFDVSEKKVEKIRENIRRCGFGNVTAAVGDATVYDETLYEKGDVVIADVPCSGLGVMGRKNDIKYGLTSDAIDDLVILQRAILDNAVKYVKPGGTLMFSTCTCSREENEGNLSYLTDVLGMHTVDIYDLLPDMLKADTATDGYVQLYGKDGLTDGFFIARLTK
ncbi:MAG: 16S rRNA (cytosine(967)-C(5))-methyltransferase RsmB [Lachnospiraceae bacterium]|nr:16S rRNA (cytosine(967)-C(5))-methyltransferase RsmB [Lachnospiraceae bacterium]